MSEVTEFDSLWDFQAADVRRWMSVEADYGVHWRDGMVDWPLWRVSYIRDTGEVYAAENGPPTRSRVRLLGVVPAGDVPDGEVYYRRLDTILDGYADPEVSGPWLAWVVHQLTRAGCSLQLQPTVPCQDPSACPLGYAPGMQSPCRVSGRCVRAADATP
jgi:hypothetical protein